MRYLKYFEKFDTETMTFWHGGNLDEYNDIISQKNGRYEYGSGLYLIDHRDTAIKYTNGGRKLYKITVAKGVSIEDAWLDLNTCIEFTNKYILSDKRKFFISRIKEYLKEERIKAYIFNNIILNNKLIKASNTKHLRQFYVDNGIDYDVIINAFGWGETMLVLYNMKKIVNVEKISREDRYK
jgi:hypothetical protein